MCAWAGGSFTKGNAGTGGWTGDASLGIGIEAGRHDTQDNDFATGINQCINKDGSNAFTGNPNLGGFIPTNIAAGTAAAPAICVGGDTNTGVFGPAADTWAVATNGSERLRVDSTGQVGIGTTAPGATIDVEAAATNVKFSRFSNATSGPNIILQKSRSATVGTNTIIENNDICGLIAFRGANGTSYNDAAYIIGEIDGTPGATNDMPGRLMFFTTPDGSGTPIERMRITNTGFVIIAPAAAAALGRLTVRSTSTSETPIVARLNATSALSTPALICAKDDNNNTTSNVFVQFVSNNYASGNGQINGNGANQAAFGSFSDIRLKENVTDLPSQFTALMALRPVEFDYKDGSGHQIGFIAQEAAEIYPDLVGEGANGYLTIAGMGKNEARLVKGFQELAQKIVDLEARVAALEA